MEFKTATQNLKKIIDAGALVTQTKPLFDPLVLTCQPTQILNRQNHGNILAVYNTYTPAFFETYTPEPEGSYTPIPHLLLGRLKSGFSSGSVTLKTDKKTLYLDDETDHYDHELSSFEDIVFPTPMKKTEHGWLPEKFDPEFSATIDSKLLDLPDATSYTFEYKNKTFQVSAPKDGNFSRKFKDIKPIVAKPLKKMIDPEYLNSVVSHLSGEIFIGFHGNIMILSKITKNEEGVELYSQTYLIAIMLEGEK